MTSHPCNKYKQITLCYRPSVKHRIIQLQPANPPGGGGVLAIKTYRGSDVTHSNLTQKYGKPKIPYPKVWVSLLCFLIENTRTQFLHSFVLEIVDRFDFRFDFFCFSSLISNAKYRHIAFFYREYKNEMSEISHPKVRKFC